MSLRKGYLSTSKIAPSWWALSGEELVQCLMYQVLYVVAPGPLKVSSFAQPQGTRGAEATKKHWQQQKKDKKKNLGKLRLTFYPSGRYMQRGQKQKNRNSPSPSCNLPPGFWETAVLSTIARCIPSPNHRRLLSSANTLFFTHLDSVSYI